MGRAAWLVWGLVTGCSLVNLDDLDKGAPQDGAGDQVAADVDAATNPTWTLPLGARSSLNAVATDSSGFVYVAGEVSAPLTVGSINIASTQGADILVIKLDPTTRQPVWAVSYGGAGDDIAYGLGVSLNGIYVVGTTTGAQMQFGGTSIPVPPSTDGPNTLHSFVARLDPLDGSVGWAHTPDANRSSATAHESICTGVAVSGADLSVGCFYQGASFGFDPANFAWNTNNSTFAIFRYKDTINGPTVQWTKSLGGPVSAAASPAVALDGNGDTWVGGVFAGAGAFDDEPAATTIVTGTGPNDAFVLKIATGTQAIAPVKAWPTAPSGIVASEVNGVTVTPAQVYVCGAFGGAANFGQGSVTSQGSLDMFALALDPATLSTTWQFLLGGSALDTAKGVATAGASAYVAGSWGSAGLTFGSGTLPAPATGGLSGGLAKLDGNGHPVSFLATTSATARVFFQSVMVDAVSHDLYAVGSYGGPTTFDDGTQATGNTTDGNGFLLRRAAF